MKFQFEYILMDHICLDIEVDVDDGAPYFTHLEPSYELISVRHNGVEIDIYDIYVNTDEDSEKPKLTPLEDLIINAAHMEMVR